MKKVIVTGGAGFIGSNLVKKLLDLNVEKLLIIDDLSTGNESNISSIVSDERVKFLNSKIEDIESINELFEDYDFCYHLAAGVGVQYIMDNLSESLLTNILAIPLLGEKVTSKQWVGVLLGFAGAGLVLGFDVGSKIPATGLIATIIALLAITFSTLWQKKLSNNLPLSVSNMNQAIGGCIFHLSIIILFVDPYIDFSQTFIIAMSHQIFLVSFGAFTILMFLIKNNSASKTVSIFFLIPATSAFMAWLFLNESLTSLDLIGFLITSIGVYIATRD